MHQASIKKPEGKVIEASFKPGKDKKGKVVEESPSQASKIRIPEKGIIREKASAETIMDRPGGGLDRLTGMTRTAARVVLDR